MDHKCGLRRRPRSAFDLRRWSRSRRSDLEIPAKRRDGPGTARRGKEGGGRGKGQASGADEVPPLTHLSLQPPLQHAPQPATGLQPYVAEADKRQEEAEMLEGVIDKEEEELKEDCLSKDA